MSTIERRQTNAFGIWGGCPLLPQLQSKGQQRHWLLPAKGNNAWRRLDQNATDCRVRMKVSPQAREAEPDLPTFWEARAIETVNRHRQKRLLLTSLTEKKAYPDRKAELLFAVGRIMQSFVDRAFGDEGADAGKDRLVRPLFRA